MCFQIFFRMITKWHFFLCDGFGVDRITYFETKGMLKVTLALALGWSLEMVEVVLQFLAST